MIKSLRAIFVPVVLLVSLVLAGCTSYSQPRYGGSGVYYDRAYHQPATRVHVNPIVYPYWSLDYFYFSRHYHPYSVIVHRHDPWFYPYPGWYYGYRPGPRAHLSFSYRYYYPWYAGGVHYHHYRPWQSSAYFSYWHYSTPRHRSYSSQDRVHQEDRRLREMQRRQNLAARASGPRRTPAPTARIGSPAVYRQQSAPVRDHRRPHESGPRIRDDRRMRGTPPPTDRTTIRHRNAPESRDRLPRATTPRRDRPRSSPPSSRQPATRQEQRRTPRSSRETPSPPASRSRAEPRSRSSGSRSQGSTPSRTRDSAPTRSRPSRSSSSSSDRRRDRDR